MRGPRVRCATGRARPGSLETRRCLSVHNNKFAPPIFMFLERGCKTREAHQRRSVTAPVPCGADIRITPNGTGAVRIASPVATAAVTGFTVMFEEHKNGWSKFIVLHGKGRVSVSKEFQASPCRLHTGQMIVWPPHPVRCPDVLNIDLSKLLRGNLVKGFRRPLSELALILADIQNQQTSPPPGGFVDPTNQDALDLNANVPPHHCLQRRDRRTGREAPLLRVSSESTSARGRIFAGLSPMPVVEISRAQRDSRQQKRRRAVASGTGSKGAGGRSTIPFSSVRAGCFT